MDCSSPGGSPWRDLPQGCWQHILRFSEPPAIARAATLNRTCKAAAYDDRLWSGPFKKALSPEPCGSLQTKRDGKDFRSLYGRWQTGQPAAVELIPEVHAPIQESGSWVSGFDWEGKQVKVIQLSQAGALAAWSLGGDCALVGTDVTTCRIRDRILPPTGFLRESLDGLSVLDSIGLVCVGGEYITGYDPRQEGSRPAFIFTYSRDIHDYIWTMTSGGLPGCGGPSQLLTGGDGPNVCLWDVRFIDGGPVRRYHGDGGTTTCLAREPHHGNLIAGGPMPFGAMNFWNFETGERVSTEVIGIAEALAAGRDRLVSGCPPNSFEPALITEWAYIDLQAGVGTLKRQRDHEVADIHRMWNCMQGVGEGPDRILVGTKSGSICMLGCGEDAEQAPICWSTGDHACPGVGISSLAAIDQVVVNGFDDGALRIMRVDNHTGQHGG